VSDQIENEVYPVYLPLPDGTRLDGCWLMVSGEVNIDDLCGAYRPGRIIRMVNADSLRYVPPSIEDYDRIAGLISDAA
jgi:hypothetical protein